MQRCKVALGEAARAACKPLQAKRNWRNDVQQPATLSIIAMNVSFAPEAKSNALRLCLLGQTQTSNAWVNGQPPKKQLQQAEYVANCHRRFNKSMVTNV